MISFEHNNTLNEDKQHFKVTFMQLSALTAFIHYVLFGISILL